MDDRLNKQQQQVQIWLREKFKGSNIPMYKINEANISYLLKLMELNREMDDFSLQQANDMEKKKGEYQKEAERMKDILNGIGLPITSLSNAGKTSLKALAGLASTLNIKDTKNSSFCLALHDLSEELTLITSQVEEERQKVEKLQTDTSNLLKVATKMVNASHNMAESTTDEPLTAKRHAEILSYKDKTQQYTTQTEQRVANTHSKKTQHEDLCKLSEELKELKHDLRLLTKKFQTYKSLPPDMHLAKVKVEETKRELIRLEQDLQSDIDVMSAL